MLESPRVEEESRRGPFLKHLGMQATAIEPGHVSVRYEVGPDHLRTGGIAHGGIIATLMDTALGLAASTMAPAGFDLVTAQLNVNLIRPAWLGEALVASAEVQHSGRKTAVATGQIHTEDGSLVATGSATLVYIPPRDLVKTGDTP